MKIVNYSLKSVEIQNNGRYLLQIVNGRKLTEIYHSHDFYELVYVMDGSCEHKINDRTHTMGSGDFVFLMPGDIHSFAGQSENLRLLGLSIGAEEFRKFEKLYGEEFARMLSKKTRILNYGHFSAKSASLLLEESGTINKDYISKIVLTYFINRFSELILSRENVLPENLSYAFGEIKKEENLIEGLPALIRLSGYSHTQLSRIVKKYFNKNPHDYIKELRLQAAYNKLAFLGKKTEDVCYSVGYRSMSHFIRVFKEKYGISPSELRKQGRESTL